VSAKLFFPSLTVARAAQSRQSLAEFFRYGWHVLEPETPLEWNWHIPVICDHIQAALEDWMAVKRWQKRQEAAREARVRFDEDEPEQRIKDLLFNVPPGTTKSRIVSVFTLPWMWLHWPSWGAIYLSSNPRVALRDALYCRDLLTSDWYRAWFRPAWELRGDKTAVSSYGNTEGGSRLAFGYFAKIVGDRKDALFLDDPNDPEEANSDKRREAVNVRWDSSIGNRVNDLRHSIRCGVQQRVNARDWTGHVLSKNRAWTQVCIPMEFEPARAKNDPDPAKHEYPRISPIGWVDPRTRTGEVLDPRRFTPEVLAGEKERLGSYGSAGQLQQRPAPPEGGIWKRVWWRYWVPAGVQLPPVIEQLADGGFVECPIVTLPLHWEYSCQSWDMAFGKSETSSMVVGQAWGLHGAGRYLLGQTRGQLDFLETEKAVLAFSRRFPDIETKFIENKANGPAIISSLRTKISGIIAVEPEGDKTARALAEQPTIESGHVYLPHPLLPLARTTDAKGRDYNWVSLFVDESAAFPNGLFNDVVDTASQALLRIRKWIAAHQDNEETHSTSGRGMATVRSTPRSNINLRR
jgi:predicted phage terminase large subunit-like protein